MDHSYTGISTHGDVRFLFLDRVVSHRLPGRATFGDVAQAVRTQNHGMPIAIDIAMDRNQAPRPLPEFLPAGFMFQDDPATAFEDLSGMVPLRTTYPRATPPRAYA